jgi:serine/threonine-protein kinase
MSSDASNNPSRIGSFEVLEKIGEGGMGVVYRAKQTSLDRLVALKVLNVRLASDEKYLDSFRREARAAARLSHSNIISVYDAGEADGYFYYAMEFISGETLAQWVRRDGALPETTALEIALCVATALKYAWEREQLIHRDIKPENIIIDSEGNVKICDLGLAKNFGENTLLSLSGQAFGTPNYMSPEQARADRAVDCRSDIYSLGLSLYFCVTNEIPYHEGTATLVMARHLTEQLPDPRMHAPNLSPHICQLLQKMAAKNVADRYQNWDEVIADIQLVRVGHPPATAPLHFSASSILVGAHPTPPASAPHPAPALAQVSGFSPQPSINTQPSPKSLTPLYNI